MITEILALLDLHPDVRVFPVKGKEPAHREVASWKIAATRDVEQVAAWWTGTDYGVGVTGLVVIDCDADTGATAQAVFGPDVASGLTWHGNPGRVSYAFAQPAQPYGCKVWAAPDGGRGGEVKGLGGYVVMPPSRHDGDGCPDCAAGTHGYTWQRRLDRAPEVPATVAAALDAIVTPPRHLVEGITVEGPLPCEADQREPCAFIAGLMATHAAAVDLPKSGRHDLMVNQQITLLRFGEREHRGIGTALDETWRVHLRALDRPGTRPDRKAQSAYEWARAMDGARRQGRHLGRVAAVRPLPLSGAGGRRRPWMPSSTPHPSCRAYVSTPGTRGSPRSGCSGASWPSSCPSRPPTSPCPTTAHPTCTSRWSGKPGPASPGVGGRRRTTSRCSTPTGWPSRGVLTDRGRADRHPSWPPTRTRPPRRRKPLIQTPESANVRCYVDEIEQLTSAGGRVGSTTDAILRAMWSGMGVGTQNADAQRRRHLVAGTYRLGVVAGVQPSLAERLLNGRAASPAPPNAGCGCPPPTQRRQQARPPRSSRRAPAPQGGPQGDLPARGAGPDGGRGAGPATGRGRGQVGAARHLSATQGRHRAGPAARHH